MNPAVLQIIIGVSVASAVGTAGGWALRGVRAKTELGRAGTRAGRETDRVARVLGETQSRALEMQSDLTEMAAAYSTLREAYDGVARQLEAARLHVGGLEDELAVQQRSAKVAREELVQARRRVGQIEGDLRALQLLAGKAEHRDYA